MDITCTRRARPPPEPVVGLTSLIPKIFAQCFSYKQLRAKPVAVVGSLRKRTACRRGKRVDSELGRYVQDTHASTHTFCVETCRILAYLKHCKLTLQQTQTHVLSATFFPGVHTYLDGVCVDTYGNEIVLEVKRGCAYRDASTGQTLSHVVTKAGQKCTDSLLNQHMLQTTLGACLYGAMHGRLLPPARLLLYVDELCVRAYTEADFDVVLEDTAHLAVSTYVAKRGQAKQRQKQQRKTTYKKKRSRKDWVKHRPVVALKKGSSLNSMASLAETLQLAFASDAGGGSGGGPKRARPTTRDQCSDTTRPRKRTRLLSCERTDRERDLYLLCCTK